MKKSTTILILSIMFSCIIIVPTIIISILNYECPHKKTRILEAVTATCTEDGITQGEVCLKCDEVLVKQEKIRAEHKFDEGTVIKKHSCKKDGQTNYTCTVCGYMEERIISAAHNFENDICTICNEIDKSSGGSGWKTWSVNSKIKYKNCVVDSYEIIDSYTGPSAMFNGVYVRHFPVCRKCNIKLQNYTSIAMVTKYSNPSAKDYDCPSCGAKTVVKIKV